MLRVEPAPGSTGSPGPKHPDVEGRALGSAALSYFLSAGSERVGLSAAAAEQLRSGCIEVRALGRAARSSKFRTLP